MEKYFVLKEKEEWSLGNSSKDKEIKTFDNYEKAKEFLKDDFYRSMMNARKYVESSFSGSGHEYNNPNYDEEFTDYAIYYKAKENSFAYISEYYLEEDLEEAKLIYHSCNDNTSIEWSIFVEKEEIEKEEEKGIDPILICKHCGKFLENVYSKQICNRTCDYYFQDGYGEPRYDFDDDNVDVTEHLGFYCNECDGKIDEKQEDELEKKYKLY